MQNSPNQQPPNGVYVDTRATYVFTFISLTIGVIIAVIVGLIIFSLRQPLTADAQGNATFSIGAIMTPLAAVVAVAIVAWAVFQLPVWFAKRQGVILDPDVWPWTGAIGVGVVAIIGFVGAMFLGII
jgi:heme/copper-type cytochrome/quinol oxidase subunit 2